MFNLNYNVDMAILVNSIDDINFMKGVLSAVGEEEIVYNIIENSSLYKSTVIELQTSYKNYSKIMEVLAKTDKHYTIHKLITLMKFESK